MDLMSVSLEWMAIVHVRGMSKDLVVSLVKTPTMTFVKKTFMAAQNVTVMLVVLMDLYVTRHLANVIAEETLHSDSVTALKVDSIFQLFTLLVVLHQMLSLLSRETRPGQQH